MPEFSKAATKWIDLPLSVRSRGWWVAGLLSAALPACTAVPAYQQQQLAKPNMVFDDTQAFAFSARLLPQCEPGTAVNGSSPGGGCTACR